MIFGLTQICYILMHVLNNVMGFSTCAKLEACNFTKGLLLLLLLLWQYKRLDAQSKKIKALAGRQTVTSRSID